MVVETATPIEEYLHATFPGMDREFHPEEPPRNCRHWEFASRPKIFSG
jgi:hypothetical protein